MLETALTCVLAEVQELKDVGVPGLHVDGKGALALAASLVDIPGADGSRGATQVRA